MKAEAGEVADFTRQQQASLVLECLLNCWRVKIYLRLRGGELVELYGACHCLCVRSRSACFREIQSPGEAEEGIVYYILQLRSTPCFVQRQTELTTYRLSQADRNEC